MSQPARPFDPLTVAIEGTNLIEASAGSGKTYGIAALFTRLVVLEKMPVESILVVTFTKAATAELKTRLRARLDDVLQALEQTPDADANDASDGLETYCRQHHDGDAFLPALLRQALAQESQARLIVRLKAAIGQFDNAAIYTIHGFCQRVLRDYAFLCQAPFDVELGEDDRRHKRQAAEDFWRSRVSNRADMAELVFSNGLTPEKVLDEIGRYAARPYLHFRRPQVDIGQAENAARATWQKVRTRLPELAETFWHVQPILNGNSYRRPTFETLFQALADADAADRLPEYHEKLPQFAADILESKVAKSKLAKGQAPDLAAFADLQMLADLGRDLKAVQEAKQQALIALKLDFLAYLDQEMTEQKKSRRERSFDDLLLDVHRALTDNPHSRQLAETIAHNWQVALIDEFQDTDPLQYEIFSTIFMRQNRPLFLVGDPKQAIYSFRGADIYAYLQAAADAQHHYTLATNYRSHSHLINGIGALFRRKTHPFVLPDIDYNDVGAARSDSCLNPPRAAIQVRWLNGKNDEVLPKDALRKRAAEYCADEIAFALNEAAAGRLNIKQRPLQSGDIAVLVRTHNEGSLVAQALRSRNIRSVLMAQQSVFAGDEARALAELLNFWLNPRHTESLRFVLGSVLFEYDAAQLFALNQNETLLTQWIESAETAAQQWSQHGIYAAMQAFARCHDLEMHLIRRGNERSLTNYHQLLERLAQEDEQSHSREALHQWLLEQITAAQKSNMPSENNVVRLESDEALVKIVTMHAAKGLQYPLVYCPFVWDAADNKAADWQILHIQSGSELLAKSQLNEADLIQLQDEETAERLRLLYVALTRAEEQLNIYAAAFGNNNGGHASSADNTFAYLLEGGADTTRAEVYEAYKNELKNGKIQGLLTMLKANWQRFLGQLPDGCDFVFTEDEPPAASVLTGSNEQTRYQAAAFPARHFKFVRHTSFTGLSRHTKTTDAVQETLLLELDAAESLARPSENGGEPQDMWSIHQFPRGTQAGLCLHDMLERLDFAQAAVAQSSLIAETLAHYGFSEEWLPALTTLLDCCRETPLTGRQSLSDIASDMRLPEMGFTLYMSDFNLTELREWFAKPHINLPAECAQAAWRLDFQTVEGYLNGFIDMVYQDSDGRVCIIDYKSNYLGDSAFSYTPQAMNEAMTEHHYYLQALIYAVAVARYFALRGRPLTEISVRYLFLRGLNGTENGIWQWDIDCADLATWV